MGFVRKIGLATLCVAFLSEGAPVGAEPAEPLAVIQLADPDPNYVPPPPEPKHARKRELVEDSSLDEAMTQFGLALGQAIARQQQLMLERCKSSDSEAASDQDRMAWEAACKYTRR